MHFGFGARFAPPAGQVKTGALQAGGTVEHASNMLNLTLVLGVIHERVTRPVQCQLEWTCGFGWSLSSRKDQELKPFFVNLRTGETTREDSGPPFSEDGSVVGG
jgi:hypothetical protein